MPKVSVITGFYNRAPVLRRTIESILGQTFDDFELIVFDDASTDDTADVLQKLAEEYRDSRFRYVTHPENRGFVRGLTDAIADSLGEYIAIQGSGDVSLPRRLERQVRLLDSRPDVGVVGGWYYNVQDGLGTRRLRQPNADNVTFNDLLKSNVFSHGEVMIRRSDHDRAGGYRTAFTFAQDVDLWLRMRKVTRFATVPEAVYERYVQFDGVSYVPKKVVEQTCFSIAARRLALMSQRDEAAAYVRISRDGPTAVVGVDDPVVQSKVWRAVVRLVVFGSPDAGRDLASASVTSRIRRATLKAFARAYGSPLARPVVPLVRRALGIGKQGSSA